MSRFEKMRIMPTDSLFDENYYVTTNKNFERFNVNIKAMVEVEGVADGAKEQSDEAEANASYAKDLAENTQQQLDQVVIDGDSSVEAAQARVNENGDEFDTLQERLNDADERFDSFRENMEDVEGLPQEVSTLTERVSDAENELTNKAEFTTSETAPENVSDGNFWFEVK
ncbi:hypothetical protein EPH95_02655 [Salicibibacter halophilus]|uniref:Uncharacterized protein n=1 Tax=Salicibibacter halophilus TaxID=2502791 RepID=A0A514LEC9_9BACI|nr:hypothetical protein [Salicibibacter halophilus]QDI90206.1 hypothetical protein EPH95_02655 [Salicibibacter halophilus]